jgi:hypothetical protein
MLNKCYYSHVGNGKSISIVILDGERREREEAAEGYNIGTCFALLVYKVVFSI